MFKRLYIFSISIIISTISLPVLACAVCYTDNGFSGASIALFIIITSFIVLFFANRILKKILNKE